MIMMNFWASHISSICSSPLVSSIVTLYALILLYVPHQFMRIVFSPVLILTGILLLTLLRLGATQRFEDENKKVEKPHFVQTQREDEPTEIKENKAGDYSTTEPEQISGSQDEDPNWVDYKSETDSESEMGFDPNPCFEESFVQWNLRAPLEVIYEEHEGEEAEDQNEKDSSSKRNEENRVSGIERYKTLLSVYYNPDSDSDNSSEGEFPATGCWDSPENMCFRWEDKEEEDEDEDDDRDGLIEIALDDHDNDDDDKRGLDFHVEEDNLIEIDISLTRNDDFPARNDGHSPASKIQITT
ncbi:Transmembrane protein [Parasponia andersonii]|uniref:Transmembrane protein n=1 Tax=Parasponia andersonii TaxID=3476 RepID=A0A2P5DCC8_PARAD|nr:Transmembrane protein [Parasponia andersonii]